MSAADDMGKLLKELIPYAINKFNLSKEDAEDIVYETGLKCLENIDNFDPSIASLKTWFIVRLKSQFLDKNKRSNIFKRVIKNTLKFNFTDRPEHLIENSFEEENRKEIKLKINPLRTTHNNRIKLQITTEKPHRANIGDLFQIKRLKDIDELIKLFSKAIRVLARISYFWLKYFYTGNLRFILYHSITHSVADFI